MLGSLHPALWVLYTAAAGDPPLIPLIYYMRTLRTVAKQINKVYVLCITSSIYYVLRHLFVQIQKITCRLLLVFVFFPVFSGWWWLL